MICGPFLQMVMLAVRVIYVIFLFYYLGLNMLLIDFILMV